MYKPLLIGIGIIALLVAGFYAFNSFIYNEKQGDVGPRLDDEVDYKNISYVIDGEVVTLTDGVHEVEEAPGSAAMMTTEYFGNEATGDLNGDGVDDIAFLLTQQGGGSGVFFYVVAALKTDGGYEGTNSLFIGNRIAVQNTEIRDGKIIVNFAERSFDEPMAAAPTIQVSKYFSLEDGMLLEVGD